MHTDLPYLRRTPRWSPPSRTPQPHAALLPHRLQWMYLHCGEVMACEECRRRVARFLADELGRGVWAAVNRPAAWYLEQVGPRHCSLEQAFELRRLVVGYCVAYGAVESGLREGFNFALGVSSLPDAVLADDGGVVLGPVLVPAARKSALEKKAGWAKWNASFGLRWLAGLVGITLIAAL